MGNRIDFAKASIHELPCEGKRSIYFDTKQQSLALYVTPTARNWYFHKWIKGKTQSKKLGTYPSMNVGTARREATKAEAFLLDGGTFDRRDVGDTFGDLFAWYMKTHANVRKRSAKEDQALYDRYLTPLANRPIAEVTRRDLRAIHARLSDKPYAANRMLALARTVFNRAIAHDMHDGINPATGIEPFKETSRDRRLTGDELPRFFDALFSDHSDDIRDYVLLSLYTGARQGNVLAMRWEEIDTAGKTWRIPVTKNGTSQTIPLEDAELEILDRRRNGAKEGWVFPGEGASGHLQEPYAGWRRICKAAGLGHTDAAGKFHPNIRIHDLRRTMGSWMVDTGASLAVIGKALNHQSQATTAIYARLSLDPVREAKRAAIEAMRQAGERREG